MFVCGIVYAKKRTAYGYPFGRCKRYYTDSVVVGVIREALLFYCRFEACFFSVSQMK